MAPRARGTCSSFELGALAMIGVIADAAEHEVVREFFELFKTPWEFFHECRQYDVLLCTGEQHFNASAKLVIVYAGRKVKFDEQQQVRISGESETSSILYYHEDRIPIYGHTVTFAGESRVLLKSEESQKCLAYLAENRGITQARIGYDLFAEVLTLLTIGQPQANASIPTLELHIAFLRDLITECGISLIEIPPVPEGFQFVACLTHDVDHPSIRQHKWDHTIFGFLYRASLDSVRKLVRGHISFRDLFANWVAVLKLPFVYLGLAKDFWREFADRYLLLEREFRSTFFIIPYKNRPGITANGAAPSFRGSGYAAQEIDDVIRKLISSGHEVGLHGIDAWTDSSKGRGELEEIQRLTGLSETGVRMHWLYYDQHSPKVLEKAGAVYDSTFGYNGTVGYRAGATQVYKPLETTRLLELPLHVMDTALFYPPHLELSPKQAAVLLNEMQNNAVRFGGVLTVNWHDRSLSPERLWDVPYRDLLVGMKSRGAWFSTAGQAVSWFRKRRSALFVTDPFEPRAVRVKVAYEEGNNLPGLRLRVHQEGQPSSFGTHRAKYFVDMTVEDGIETSVPFEARR
jgi:peptidoglycan/xylan/chitin deacetylase (PgdA/CDA1 family)